MIRYGTSIRWIGLLWGLSISVAFGQVGVPDFTLVPDDTVPEDLFGFSADATPGFLVVGAYGQDAAAENAGAVYVYRSENDIWNPAPAKLTAPEAQPGARFGWAISVDAPHLAIGAPEANRAAFEGGTVHLYRFEAEVWTPTTVLTASDALPGDEFGSAVALHQDVLLVGAPGSPGSAVGGAVYVLQQDAASGTWVEQAKLVPDDVMPGDAFGWSVSLYEDVALVGALYHGRGGAAYVFQREGNTWRQTTKLSPPDEAPMDLFGYAVSTYENLIAVGAPNRDRPSTNLFDDAGAVYVYARDRDAWALETVLTPDLPEPGSRYGHSLDLGGNNEIVVGARYASATTDRAGGIFWYRRRPEGWMPRFTLVPPDAPLGYAGHAVALDHHTWAFVTAPWTANGQGLVYAYNLLSFIPTIPDVPPETAYRLSLPFPHPAIYATDLVLEIGKTQHVRVAAYDLLGRPVAVLYNDYITAKAPQTIRFDTHRLPAGTYLVQAIGTTFRTQQTVLHTGLIP